MRTIEKIAQYFKMRKKHLDAIGKAREFFKSKSKLEDHPSMAKVIATTDIGLVVRLCYGSTKPPKRAFFKVNKSGDIDELEFDQVRQYGERVWR